MKQSADHLQPNPSETSMSENLFDAEVLIAKVESRSDLFRPLRPRDRQVIKRLDEKERMQYILENLALIPSIYEFPRISERKFNRTVSTAMRKIQRAASTEVDGVEAIGRIENYLDQLVSWLSTPLIYDRRKGRDAHDQRRLWRDEMVKLFDHDLGRNASGPFSDSYRTSKMSANITANVFGVGVVVKNLKAVGLENTQAEIVSRNIVSLKEQFLEIEDDDIEKKKEFIKGKLIPLVEELLTKLAHREYTSTQVETEIDAYANTGEHNDGDDDHEFGQEPDWLNEHFPSSSDF